MLEKQKVILEVSPELSEAIIDFNLVYTEAELIKVLKDRIELGRK